MTVRSGPGATDQWDTVGEEHDGDMGTDRVTVPTQVFRNSNLCEHMRVPHAVSCLQGESRGRGPRRQVQVAELECQVVPCRPGGADADADRGAPSMEASSGSRAGRGSSALSVQRLRDSGFSQREGLRPRVSLGHRPCLETVGVLIGVPFGLPHSL